MNSYRFISWLFAVFVIVGLIGAPLATSAAASQRSLGDMSAMSEDMPCCPAGHKNKSCPDCPFVATCMLMVVQAEPSATKAVQLSFQARKLSFAIIDLVADGLARAPPDHPPRILT